MQRASILRNVGLLLHSSSRLWESSVQAAFKEGIRRVENNHQDFAPSRLRVSKNVGGTRRCEGRGLFDEIVGGELSREGAKTRRAGARR